MRKKTKSSVMFVFISLLLSCSSADINALKAELKKEVSDQKTPIQSTANSPVSSGVPPTVPVASQSSPSSVAVAPETDDIPSVDIEGIGQFKIGMTVDNFYKLYPSPKITQIYSSEYFSFRSGALEVTPKTEKLTTLILSSGNFCPDAKQFIIKDYQVNDLKFELDLTFYKGQLQKITTDSSQIESAIETKYGKGKETSDIKDVSCISKLTGNSFTESESTFRQKWKNSKKNIEATSSLFGFVDSKCQKSASRIFYIIHRDSESSYNKCNDEFKKKAEEQLNAQVKQGLSDL